MLIYHPHDPSFTFTFLFYLPNSACTVLSIHRLVESQPYLQKAGFEASQSTLSQSSLPFVKHHSKWVSCVLSPSSAPASCQSAAIPSRAGPKYRCPPSSSHQPTTSLTPHPQSSQCSRKQPPSNSPQPPLSASLKRQASQSARSSQKSCNARKHQQRSAMTLHAVARTSAPQVAPAAVVPHHSQTHHPSLHHLAHHSRLKICSRCNLLLTFPPTPSRSPPHATLQSPSSTTRKLTRSPSSSRHCLVVQHPTASASMNVWLVAGRSAPA